MQTLIYSHTDYLDILNIQIDCINKFTNPDLIINSFIKNEKINKIYTYDDKKPYGDRIFNCILSSNLNEKYTFLIHDVDLVLNISEGFFDELVNVMDVYKIDRLDLKHQNSMSENSINLKDKTLFSKKFPRDQYVYNVNPSIWRTDVLLKTFSLFRNQNYREIEHSGIQNYCSENFNFYTINSKKPINMGYYDCYQEFKFLHISHYGQFLPLDIKKTNMQDENFSIYKQIIFDYNLTTGKRKFRESMY